jgi:hypothetical protein
MLINIPAMKACGETAVVPKIAAIVANMPTVGMENAARPFALCNENMRYVKGNAASNKNLLEKKDYL